MSYLLLLPHIRVENANAVAGLTWGYPAITHFLGYVHALSRKISQTYSLTLSGCAVISHEHQTHAYASGREYQFALTRNPLTKEGKTASFNEEGRMHLTVSLLVECEGEIPNGEHGMAELCERLRQLCPAQKLAGGSIVGMRDPILFYTPTEHSQWRKILWRLMPGFALCDRTDWLKEHHNRLQQTHPDSTMMDAWLDFTTQKFKAAEDVPDGEQVPWHYQPKPMPGYLVPLMCGYQRVSRLYGAGEVANARDSVSPFAFAEAVYGVGEWRGLHRIADMQALFWRYQNTETGYYCLAQPVPDDILVNDDDDSE
ncbi:type I-F CRISPR-associated protein Csy2 [Enterobacter asburiae]|uniref:type I-F CRISPR-associated protein Csy2 n=1 Tax=Scandinavium sp. UTDF21-P1B TaxID=3446379 RepID=UPI0034821330